jgi:3-oxoacyl-ACP reductase-like protein
MGASQSDNSSGPAQPRTAAATTPAAAAATPAPAPAATTGGTIHHNLACSFDHLHHIH